MFRVLMICAVCLAALVFFAHDASARGCQPSGGCNAGGCSPGGCSAGGCLPGNAQGCNPAGQRQVRNRRRLNTPVTSATPFVDPTAAPTPDKQSARRLNYSPAAAALMFQDIRVTNDGTLLADN